MTSWLGNCIDFDGLAFKTCEVHRVDDVHVAYAHDIPKLPRTTPLARYEQEWYHVLKFFTDKGVMFRAVELMMQYWLPGTLDRSRNRFVWRRQTVEELKGMGIEFTCTLRRGADVRRIKLRAPWLMGAGASLDVSPLQLTERSHRAAKY
ncbi:hypothetical protein HWV62_9839 [Athelia sp. TMB]|nr:hypothetical protein HWV62_9839 [Athelia sp. TMB]